MNMLKTGLTTAVLLSAALALPASAQYSVTVLHNNDGESEVNASGGIGGIAEFTTLVKETRSFYEGIGHGVVTISSGDNFIPSKEFSASLNSGAPGSRTFFSALALDEIGYDAVVIGNHEFDAGPDVLAEFIADAGSTQFLSSNLDVSGVPSLVSLGGQISGSTIANVSTAAGTKQVGIIGATTTNLPFITSPGDVTVSDVATAVNAELASLLSSGVDSVILASHLQGLSEDQALVSLLNPGIDLIIAGGGDEVLADLAAPSPTASFGGSAPLSVVDTGLAPSTPVPADDLYPVLSTATDAGGNNIAIVTTPGEYDYLGRVTLEFDAGGNFAGIESSSNMQLNTGFAADPTVQANTVDPINAFIAGLESQIIMQTTEFLPGNGNRNVIRAEEAGLGNLVADGLLASALTATGSQSLATPALAFVNGGGIRTDVAIGDISVGTSFDISPFGNILTLVEGVTREDLALIFENAVSQVDDADPTADVNPDQTSRPNSDTGRFLHVSENVVIKYNIDGTPLLQDDNGFVTQAGNRLMDVIIDGAYIVKDGVVVPGSDIDLVTLDFLAVIGGNQLFNKNYLSQDYSLSATRLGLTDQQALQAYLEGLAGGDSSFDLVSDSRYDNVADGRIQAVPSPSVALAGLMGLAAVATRRRRNG